LSVKNLNSPALWPASATATAAAEAVGERRYLTVMFCDLVGPTSISAQLGAEEWRDPVSSYLDAASEAVNEMGGHVAKKLGDGLMSLFGYPLAQENDAERGARAALSTQCALVEVNQKNTAPGKPVLNARIGIEIGPVGSMRRARFTAMRPMSRRGYRRWRRQALSSSQRGSSVRSPACLSPRSAAATNSKSCLSQ
jgi:hypothetical protein